MNIRYLLFIPRACPAHENSEIIETIDTAIDARLGLWQIFAIAASVYRQAGLLSTG